MQALEAELRESISGEVSFDAMVRKVYSVDASIYEIEPVGVVWPKTREDVIQAVRIANSHEVPIIARGAATGIVGGCIGKGLIIDTSKYLNRILHIDMGQEYALCEPGVVQDQLNAELASNGYRLGPDTSTGNRATLGGMIGNNSAGAYSLRYGKMVDHLEECELVLSSGEVLYFGPSDDAVYEAKRSLPGVEGRIYREIHRIQNDLSEDILAGFPDIPRRVSGYNFDELRKPGPLNVCKLITGSEGSLGVITRVKVRISPKPRATGLCIIHFRDLFAAFDSVGQLLSYKPLALEVMDRKVVEMGRLSPSMRGKLSWLKDNPDALFVAAFDGEDVDEVREKVNAFAADLVKRRIGYAHSCLFDPTEMANVWALRKSGLGLLLARRSYSRAIAFIEDLSVHPTKLGPLMRELDVLFHKYDKEAGCYGHAGPGCIHVRPYIDLGSESDRVVMRSMMEEAADIVLSLGGALSGEHGDGLTRSWLNKKMFGPKIYQGFIDLKRVFDPSGRMNPGKVISNQDFLDNLRFDPGMPKKSIETQFDYSAEGGLHLAVDMCNGNGQCRKREGLMCPSFQATLDERHSTRARAQSLRAIFNGRIGMEEWTGESLKEIMDLCLECKGCKMECPSEVDMAKLKAEFLYHYYGKHHRPLRDYLFGHIGKLNRLGSMTAPISNWIARRSVVKWLLGQIGIAPERDLPAFSSQRFSQWMEGCIAGPPGLERVALFNDSFTEFNVPQVGKAAYAVLRGLEFEVVVPPWTCCGRPLISKGLLKQAKKQAERLVDTFLPYAEEGMPIIGLEPSCILTIADDYPGLISTKEARLVASACITFDAYLSKMVDDDRFDLILRSDDRDVKVHGHCHQKSLVGMEATMNVLRALPHVDAEVINSGCCGVAGSFGYEQEHYELSRQIGELHLLPAVRASSPDTILIANGLSCRSQIAHGTGRTAIHLAEFIADRLA